MLKIGLTGGIGSGKTTVAKIFTVLGIPVYYADIEAKRIMNEDPELRRSLITHFGAQSYENDQLNRKYLASQVFTDPYKLELLNSIVHPVTINDAEQWMKKQSTLYVIKEAALLFEAGAAEHLDLVIGVTAPQALRMKRVMERDNITREDVLKRMRNQVDEVIKMRLCDFVINNDEQSLVIPQVLDIDRKLKEMAGARSSS